MIHRLLVLVAALLAVPALAADPPQHIVPSLVAETPRPAPGSTVTLAGTAPGWHG